MQTNGHRERANGQKDTGKQLTGENEAQGAPRH